MLKRGLVWGFGSITEFKLLSLTLRINAYFSVFENFSGGLCSKNNGLELQKLLRKRVSIEIFFRRTRSFQQNDEKVCSAP